MWSANCLAGRFFDDIELLRQKWQSSNGETVAELYVHFCTINVI